ncbi:hypothetical protein B7P43_G15958 [Cryptotermes secundus]|uniref:Calbindin-32 n=1 Tax=Cryptotermes secundus TaxID=105785 RepID=A0A2J7RGK8_9NEOP|nr:hypothetical protein B7P43_G15958 [Cryptotermes secundus]
MAAATAAEAAAAAARAKKLNLEKATNFMRQYRDPQSRELKKLSANQFMEVWSHYDKDESPVSQPHCHAPSPGRALFFVAVFVVIEARKETRRWVSIVAQRGRELN